MGEVSLLPPASCLAAFGGLIFSPSLQLAQAKVEFDAKLAALQTEQGIWNDITIFYAFGSKTASPGTRVFPE
jgi:hypothetical protein